ncbi:NADP-dependent oxidoreductase [Streptomyces xiamenensis]|uniref:NADP-dependent oxidoreductase n=1 Tax=Streptomyces TaxID=1883 RepID=UPI0004C51285|nr:NADP-dependent oxidoreductase [Streptomyces sp. NRRL F-2890]
MPKAVLFDAYGGPEVLRVADVAVPEPEGDRVLVRVLAAAINPGEAMIREGLLHDRWPATFPSGQGSDLAGVVERTGPGAQGVATGDEVLGYTDERASHAEYVSVPAGQLTAKPPNVPWEVAGSLAIAGSTGYACVRAVAAGPGDRVAVAGAAGGVGSIAAQLARHAGAEVIGIAGPAHHSWLSGRGIQPMGYGEGLEERLRAAGIDALIDTHGTGYVRLAIDLGVAPERVNTVADFTEGPRYGVRMDGASAATGAGVLAELAALVADGALEVPIAATYPLTEVRAAYEHLATGHIQGKIVLLP